VGIDWHLEKLTVSPFQRCCRNSNPVAPYIAKAIKTERNGLRGKQVGRLKSTAATYMNDALHFQFTIKL